MNHRARLVNECWQKLTIRAAQQLGQPVCEQVVVGGPQAIPRNADEQIRDSSVNDDDGARSVQTAAGLTSVESG
jgi:hypothetical protein